MKKLVYLIVFIVGSLNAQQFYTVTSTITAQTGTGNYTDVDELLNSSDTDYLTSDDNATTTWEAKFSSITDPGSNAGIYIIWREAQADGNVAPSSGGSASSYTAGLYQGATLIATLATSRPTNETSFATESYGVTQSEVANITDWTDLRVRFDFVGGGGSPSARRGVAVSYVHLLTVENSGYDVTTVLNTADASAFGTDNTPTLEFTGTDNVATDDLEYKVDIMTSHGTSVDNYETGTNTNFFIGINNVIRGQTFTGNGTKLHSAEFRMQSASSPIGYVTAKLYAITGTHGTNATPTGNALAVSAPIQASTLSTSFEWVSFYFDGSFTMTNSVNYAILVTYTGSSGFINMPVNSTTSSHSGNSFVLNYLTVVGYSSSSTTDLYFRINSEAQSLLKNSENNAGFLNTVDGGDTHPFNETEQISFTVQNADYLADGTYYWRVQAKSPTTADTYHTWSEIRSFTVTGGSPPVGMPNNKRVITIN